MLADTPEIQLPFFPLAETVHIQNYLEDKKLCQGMLVREIAVVVCTSSSVSSVSIVVVMFSCAYR